MITKRGDGWAVAVYNPVTKGKRWVGTFATQRQAREAEANATLSRRRSTATVAQYAASWLRLHPRARLSTVRHYEECLRAFLVEHGSTKLDDWSRPQALAWAVAHRTALPVVRAMFSDARRDGLVAENPFTDLRLQQSRGRRDLDVLSVDQVQALAEVARKTFGPGFAAFVLTAAYTGMRPGELYALRWPRIRFGTGEIEIAASYSTKSRETTAPKNNRHRLIVLFPEAREALSKVPRDDGTVVFRTLRGKPLDGASLSYYWNPVRIAVGLPGLDTYALRHFCAAHLLNTLGHEAEDVAYQLGHTDGGVLVRKLYGHPSEELARERLKAGFGRKTTLVDLNSVADREQNTA